MSLTFVLCLGGLYSCGGGTADADKAKTEKAVEKKTPAKKAVNQNGKEYTSRWLCADRCAGSGSDARGQKCPNCGKDYVENPKHAHHGHNH